MTATIHNLRDYTKHKPELDPKQDKPANVIVLPMIREGWNEPPATVRREPESA